MSALGLVQSCLDLEFETPAALLLLKDIFVIPYSVDFLLWMMQFLSNGGGNGD